MQEIENAQIAVAEPPPLFDEGDSPSSRKRGGVPWLTASAIAISLIGGSIFCYLIQRSSDTASAGPAAPSAITGVRPGVDLDHHRWPASFDAQAPSRAPKLDATLVLRPVLADMQLLQSSYRDQLQQVRFAELACPSLRPSFQELQFAFDAKYQRPLEQIGTLLSEWKLAPATPAAAINAQPEMSVEAGTALLNKLRGKTEGGMTPRQKELLFAFDPNYMMNPAQEFLDGHLHQYNSERAVHGLALHLKYPTSWLASEPGGRTVRLLRDRRCMLNMVSLRIDDLPRPGISSARDLDDLLDLSDIRQGAPDAKLDGAGIVDLPKAHEALWREFRLTRTIEGREYKLRAVDLAMIHNDRYVSIGFTAGAAASASSADLDAAFARNAPLFRLIASGMEIED